MDPLIRFSSLVRHGLRFRSRLELIKKQVAPPDFAWYPYDSFVNLFFLERLRRMAGLTFTDMAGTGPLLDLGTADGALAFLFESLGFRVHACDNSGTNMNRMEGVRLMAAALDSHVEIEDIDLDNGWDPGREYGLALFLGTLYHLKNPFAVLERLAKRARYCFVSTRVACWSPDHTVELGRVPAAYLLAPDECNNDTTNYWVFSPPGLIRLAERSGWSVLASLRTGASESDPTSAAGDERQFLLLEASVGWQAKAKRLPHSDRRGAGAFACQPGLYYRIGGQILRLLFTSFLAAGLALAQTSGRVDFRSEIRPIFQEHCIGCHGPTQQMGGMRLDRRSSAMGIRRGTTIGPGNAEGSKLYLKLVGTKYGGRMPPTGPLPSEQIALIKAWIDQGAEWPDDLAGEKASAPADPRAARMMETLRTGDHQRFAELLRDDPEAVKLKGPGGSTTLMYAALYGDLASVRQLIDHGADVNASNDAGATALMWAIDDLDKVRLLLDHGADPNAMSVDSRTPLAIALGNKGSAAVVKLLLDHGANLEAKNPRGRSLFAGAGGDEAVLHILMEHGVKLEQLAPALGSAIASECLVNVNLLLPAASKPALNFFFIDAAADRNDRVFRILLEHDADVKAAEPGLAFTALMYAANAEIGSGERVKDLIKRGADVNAKTADGSTALDFALRSGNAAAAEALRKAGAKEGDAPQAPVVKPKPAASIEAAIERSIPLLQRSDVAFIKKSGCVSCHNNNLTAMTVAAARKQGVRVDENIARAQLKAIAAYVESTRERYLQGVPIAGRADTTSYILLGMAAEGWPSDPATDAMARFLKAEQAADGKWRSFGARPPIESSDIQNTATVMRVLQTYTPKTQQADYQRAIQLGAEWIAKAQPLTTEDRAFQVLGLAWAAKLETARQAGRILLREQRSDGGWGQSSSLPSDAYATGQALVALNEAGVLALSDAAYKRGAQFLLDTQLEDGSWYVRSRTVPFQPYFDAGFPHGPDQFISAAATNWATMALLRVKPAAQ